MGLKSKLSETMYKIKHNPSFTVKEQLGYAGGMFGNCMGQDCFYTYHNKFNRDFLNIHPDHLIAMGNITQIFSFVIPPIAGNMLDRPVKEGKKSNTKKILLATPFPFAIASMLLFVVPSKSSFVNLIWSFIFTMIFLVVDTFFDMALSTISLRMTTNPEDRKNFYTISSLASSLGSMLPGWILPIILGRFDNANDQKWAYFFVALVFCIIGVCAMSAPYFTLNEKVGIAVKVNDEEKVEWNRQTVSAVFHNRPFIISMIATVFETVRQVTYDMLPYLYQNTFDDYGMKAIIDMISGTLSYVGLFSVPLVGKKVSARTMLMGGHIYSGLFYSVASLMAVNFDLDRLRRQRYLTGVLIGFSGMPNSGMAAARKILVADSTDYMEWYTEKKYGSPIRSDGLLMAVQSITGRINSLLRTNIYNFALKFIGYQSGQQDASGKAINVVQSMKALKGIYLVTTLCGVIGNFLPAMAYATDTFTGKRRSHILEELNVMREKRGVKDLPEEAQEETQEETPAET